MLKLIHPIVWRIEIICYGKIRSEGNHSRHLQLVSRVPWKPRTISAKQWFINDSRAISFPMIIRGPREIFIVAVQWLSRNFSFSRRTLSLGSHQGLCARHPPLRRHQRSRTSPPCACRTVWYMQKHFCEFWSSGSKKGGKKRKKTGEEVTRAAWKWNGGKKLCFSGKVSLLVRWCGKLWDYRRAGDGTFVSRTQVNDGSSLSRRGM